MWVRLIPRQIFERNTVMDDSRDDDDPAGKAPGSDPQPRVAKKRRRRVRLGGMSQSTFANSSADAMAKKSRKPAPDDPTKEK